ncbi:hypothetical protein [Streptomyces sp. SAS_276]|uniref:hypothetical protein n=1 Tax=Streptomyces sp. SAS_276 TaxID=3412745 RepID=UPI00403C1B81
MSKRDPRHTSPHTPPPVPGTPTGLQCRAHPGTNGHGPTAALCTGTPAPRLRTADSHRRRPAGPLTR